ncbi:MAG: hypothetical protein ACHQF4_00370 [Sphingobacteriales bacterium]
MNSIEEKLWNYIDGTCSLEEQQAISLLIAQDEVYRKKHKELMALNAEFTNMEMDEPPMAFTYNVMETIRNDYAMQPLKARVDQRIVKGIGLFFGLIISAILIYALTTVHWSVLISGGNTTHFVVPSPTKFLSSPVMGSFMFLDVVLALYILDVYLHKKNLTKTYTSVQSGGQQK